jgi:ribose transport system substrate-binding protein
MRNTCKILSIILVAVVVFSSLSAEVLAAKKDGIVIGFSNASISNSWRVFMVANFEAEVALHPEIEKYYYTDANDRPEKQIADIDDLLMKGIDVLIVSPCVQDAVNPGIERAFEMGIPVILIDRGVTTDQYTTFVEASSYDMGKGMAEWLAKELGGKGNIVMLSGVAGSMPAEDRFQGARDALKEYPDITILGQQYTDWSPVKAKAVMEAFVQQYEQIDGIWADSGMLSAPALEVLKEAGRPLVPSTADQYNGYAKLVVNNNARGFIYPYPAWQSREAVKHAIKAVQGEELPKYIKIPVEPIGPDQIKDYVKMDKPDFWWVGDDQMPEEFLPEL